MSGASRREWTPLDQIAPLLYSGRVIGHTYQRMRSDSPVMLVTERNDPTGGVQRH